MSSLVEQLKNNHCLYWCCLKNTSDVTIQAGLFIFHLFLRAFANLRILSSILNATDKINEHSFTASPNQWTNGRLPTGLCITVSESIIYLF